MLRVCINSALTDDELRCILWKLDGDKDKDVFGLVCKRWLHLQSTERKKLCVRAGSHMLCKMAARFSRLFQLDLSQSPSRSFYPGVTDSDLCVIATGFIFLQVLNLQNCKGITDSGIVAIGKGLPSLKCLNVSYCRKLTDKGLSSIAEGCSDLRCLFLAGCRHITDTLLKALSRNCHNLEELGLQACTNITDSGLEYLVHGCQRIKFLDLNKCIHVGDVGISSLSQACSSSLVALKSSDCYPIGDDSIFSLARSCKNLETLIVDGCRKISDESMKFLALSLNHSLKNLRVDWCSNISDFSLSSILSQCRNLEILDISSCEKVTDSTFQGLESEGPKLALKVLKASNCPKITVAGIGVLLSSCSSLRYLDVRECPRVTEAGCEDAGLGFPECCKVNFSGSLKEPLMFYYESDYLGLL